MGDFQIFLKAVQDGNLKDVIRSFKADFLKLMTDGILKMRPIHFACQNGHLEVVKFLVKNRCSVECENEYKKRPIHLACKFQHFEIVKFLLENKCSLECEDEYMTRPIHLACDNGYLEIVKFLFQNKCTIECETSGKKRPIHLACQNGHLEIVKFLLQNKCSVECSDDQKMRPIHFACWSGHLIIVKFLLQFNCELDCRTKNGETAMEIARKRGHRSCENYLNEILESRRKIFECIRRNDAQAFGPQYSADILIMEQRDTGFSLLELILQSNANQIIDYLFNKFITAEELSKLENYMKNCGRSDAVQLIQECLLYRSIRFHDADGFYLSGLAKTINGRRKMVKSSFLEVAAEYGCKPFIHSLLEKSVYNEKEWTKAKDLAILKGYVEIAEAISRRKIFLRKRTNKKFTWLHSAICDNDPDMVKYILESRLVDPDSNNEVVGTALALAHMMCYEDCIEVLEKFNVDVNTQNKYFQSPLHEAIASDTIDHCSYLISRVQDIDRPGFMGFTGLQCAVIQGYEELCDQLVNNGADCVQYVEILHQSSINQTVLPISKSENAVTLCMKINKTIYPCFLEVLDFDNKKCSDGEGNSLLHMAVKTLQPDLCKTLIKSGSNVEALNDQGASPLFVLLSNGGNGEIKENVEELIKTLNILIESGTDVNKLSNSGVNIFQVASQWNSEKLMLSLLSKRPKLTCLTETDFKLAFTKHWFEYATTLISLTTGDFLQSSITDEIIKLGMMHSDTNILVSLFEKCRPEVQQSIIEDLLDYFAAEDKYNEFVNLLNTGIVNPKLLSNGETLLTNLLKEKNLNYCWAILNCENNTKYTGMANAINQIPLQIAIESDLFDVINPLIFKCDNQSNTEFDWDAPLISMLQKVSISTDNEVDQKLLTAIKAIINRGGDIFKKIVSGSPIIDYCTRFALKNEITTFEKKERKKERDEKNICSICHVKKVNCTFLCGHLFCMDCGTPLSRCAICKLEVSKPIIFSFV